MRVAVCDDDIEFRDEFKGILYTILFDLKEEYDVREFSNGRELLACRERFDLIFHDIEMDEIDGRRVARYYKERRNKGEEVPIVIFTTVHPEYSYEGYEHGIFRYLMKPILINKLKEYYLSAKDELARLKGEEFLVPYRDGKKRIRYGDVYYFETDSSKREIVIHTRDGIYRRKGTFKALIEELEGRSFFKVNISYIVNLMYVDEYDKKRGKVYLHDGSVVEMSLNICNTFEAAWHRYFREGVPVFAD